MILLYFLAFLASGHIQISIDRLVDPDAPESALRIRGASGNASAMLSPQSNVTDPDLFSTASGSEKTSSIGAQGASLAKSPSLYTVTFISDINKESEYTFLTSANHHDLAPVVLGVGKPAHWGRGLGVKINALRTWLLSMNLHDTDIIFAADTSDVVILAAADEFVRKFLSLEASSGSPIIFGREKHCHSVPGNRKEFCDANFGESPNKKSEFRLPPGYLNAGLLIGRAAGLKRMLRDPVPDYLEEDRSDQEWFQKYYASHPHEILLDRDMELLGNVYEFDDYKMTGARLVVSATNKAPCAVHFPGPGHWNRLTPDGFTSPLIDVLNAVDRATAEKLRGETQKVILNLPGGAALSFSSPLWFQDNFIYSWRESFECMKGRGLSIGVCAKATCSVVLTTTVIISMIALLHSCAGVIHKKPSPNADQQ